jgi:hypothetical protein
MFVIYAQPLDRRSKCFPVHVIQNPSGQAKKVVQDAVDAVCSALVAKGIVPKYVCSDGDACFNARHHAFFRKWYLAFLRNGDRGLEAALEIARRETKIPVGDFLHMWKNFCNKVKNHPVTLCPESTDDLITCEDLRSMLDLGSVLTDKTSIGKMRDSYALQLFSWLNCVKCVQNGNTAATMYLLPWTLQEEVIRSPELTREDRLKKAILNFEVLNHYFDLAFLPSAAGVTQRYDDEVTEAVTFAENSVWPRILNNALVLIQFVMDAPPSWSFSRLGTHCLENFFGFVRQNAHADDRSVTALGIISRTAVVTGLIHDMKLKIVHRTRDNVGGVVIDDYPLNSLQPALNEARLLAHSFIAMADLDFDSTPRQLLDLDRLTVIMNEWRDQDHHHKNDPAYKADFTFSPANSRIAARNVQTSSARQGPA